MAEFILVRPFIVEAQYDTTRGRRRPGTLGVAVSGDFAGLGVTSGRGLGDHICMVSACKTCYQVIWRGSLLYIGSM
jgi:hypothetical protein